MQIGGKGLIEHIEVLFEMAYVFFSPDSRGSRLTQQKKLLASSSCSFLDQLEPVISKTHVEIQPSLKPSYFRMNQKPKHVGSFKPFE